MAIRPTPRVDIERSLETCGYIVRVFRREAGVTTFARWAFDNEPSEEDLKDALETFLANEHLAEWWPLN